MRTSLLCGLLCGLLFCCTFASGDDATVSAPMPAPVPVSAADATVPQEESLPLVTVVRSGGVIGFVICLLSLAVVALTIEHFLTIRAATIVPTQLARDVHDLLAVGNIPQARQRCKDETSVLGQMLSAGLSEYELGWRDVERGVEESAAEHAARLYRKVEYLNVIGNIAPMLGLLGTVVGMIIAFRHLADAGGYSRGAELAEGIYLALVTTVEGLIVAIPSLAFYAILCNRIAYLMAEATYIADQTLAPLKRAFVLGNAKNPKI
ncbi:MAG: MotA/TolQ/ExbB proton channel family protein [Thermoguttaceae bacterium]